MSREDIVKKFREKKLRLDQRLSNWRTGRPSFRPMTFPTLEEERAWLEAKMVRAEDILALIDRSIDRMDAYREKVSRHKEVIRPKTFARLSDMGLSRKGLQLERQVQSLVEDFYSEIANYEEVSYLIIERKEKEPRGIVSGSDRLSRPKTQLQLKKQYLDLISWRSSVNRISNKMAFRLKKIDHKEKKDRLESKLDTIKEIFENKENN